MLDTRAIGRARAQGLSGSLAILGAALLLTPCFAQVPAAPVQPSDPQTSAPLAGDPQTADPQTKVNWLYGTFVPKEVPLETLDANQRLQLYFRQTFTTPGLYGETTLLALHDQLDRDHSNPQWGPTLAGFAKRMATREAEAVVQNSITSLGDGLLGWEPRYDRCRCDGFWRRAGHAFARNFVTYDRTEKSLRPQIMPYLGAFSGAALATAWEPGSPKWQIEGYQAAVLQVAAGLGVNLISEFASDIGRLFHRKKTVAVQAEHKH